MKLKPFFCIILAELIDILIVFVFFPVIAAGNLDLPLADEPVVLVVGIVLGVPPKQMFSYCVPCVDFNQKTQYTLYNVNSNWNHHNYQIIIIIIKITWIVHQSSCASKGCLLARSAWSQWTPWDKIQTKWKLKKDLWKRSRNEEN